MICDVCGRERTSEDFDYSPLQVINNQPLGWYSNREENICPEDMTKMLREQ